MCPVDQQVNRKEKFNFVPSFVLPLYFKSLMYNLGILPPLFKRISLDWIVNIAWINSFYKSCLNLFK